MSDRAGTMKFHAFSKRTQQLLTALTVRLSERDGGRVIGETEILEMAVAAMARREKLVPAKTGGKT